MNDNSARRQNSSQARQPRQSAHMNRTKQTSSSKRSNQSGKPVKRKRTSVSYKVLALAFIVVIIVVGGLFIKNFGAGSQASNHGMEAFQNGDYARAVTYFGQAVNYDGNNMQYRLQLGMAQIQNASFDEALKTLDEMYNRAYTDTDKQSALRGMGIAYLYTGQYAEAVSVLSDAMAYAGRRYTEQEIDISYYLAEAQDKSGDPVEAVLTYTKILAQKESANAYRLRGEAYQKVGDNTNAETDLYKAIEMSKQDYKVYLTLYQVLIAQGKSDKAAALLEEAVTLPVRNSEDYSNRGFFYMYMKEYDLSMADFDTALADGYVPAYFGKANLLMEQGRYEEAVTNFGSYFEQVQDNALAYNQYGVCMMQLGDYNEAASVFGKGLALNDRIVDRELMYNEIVVTERLGSWSEAYTKATAFLGKYPDDERMQREIKFLQSRQK